MNTQHPEVTVIIPAHNEVTTISTVVKAALKYLPTSREIVIVDDGSIDGTAAVIEALAQQHADLILVRRAKNGGKGAALRDGIQRASGRYVLFQDADLELDPVVYPNILELLRSGHRVVYGSRFADGRGRAPLMTTVANRFLTLMTNALFGLRLTDMESGHKAFDSALLKSLPLSADGYDIEPEITALIARRGEPIIEVSTSYRPRGREQGKRIGLHDGLRAIRTLWRYRFG